jgi:hypothetical protein
VNSKFDHFKALNSELSTDGDRACAIVCASILDNHLEELLKCRLTPNSSSKDTLFDDSNAPLGTFSVRIDLSCRLGLISPRLARDLHLIRKVRNDFAHSYIPLKFEDAMVCDRVKAIVQSCDIPKRHPLAAESPYDTLKGKFVMVVIFLMLSLQDLIKNTKAATPALEASEIIYDPNFELVEGTSRSK